MARPGRSAELRSASPPAAPRARGAHHHRQGHDAAPTAPGQPRGVRPDDHARGTEQTPADLPRGGRRLRRQPTARSYGRRRSDGAPVRRRREEASAGVAGEVFLLLEADDAEGGAELDEDGIDVTHPGGGRNWTACANAREPGSGARRAGAPALEQTDGARRLRAQRHEERSCDFGSAAIPIAAISAAGVAAFLSRAGRPAEGCAVLRPFARSGARRWTSTNCCSPTRAQQPLELAVRVVARRTSVQPEWSSRRRDARTCIANWERGRLPVDDAALVMDTPRGVARALSSAWWRTRIGRAAGTRKQPRPVSAAWRGGGGRSVKRSPRRHPGVLRGARRTRAEADHARRMYRRCRRGAPTIWWRSALGLGDLVVRRPHGLVTVLYPALEGPLNEPRRRTPSTRTP